MIAIGRHLIEAKERVGHGRFLAWIEEKFPRWHRSTAWRYMTAAEQFPDVAALQHFTQEALFLLSGPSVPEEARDEAVDRAEAGERITKAEAEAMIAAARSFPAGRRARPEPGTDR